MSVMPLLPQTVSPAAQLSAESGAGEGAEGFAALLAGMLGGGEGQACRLQSPGDGERHGSPASAPLPAVIGSDLAEAAPVAQAMATAVPALTMVSAAVTPPAGAAGHGTLSNTGTASAVTDPTVVAVSTDLTTVPAVTGDTAATPVARDGAPATGDIVAATATTSTTTPGGPSTAATSPASPNQVVAVMPTTTAATGTPDALARAKGTAPATTPTLDNPTNAATSATVQPGTAQPSAVQLGAALPGAAATPAVAQSPVTAQVVEQIAQLVTSAGTGNGTQRVTLKLQPEQLGDVRVVLTVRDGAMHVQLAAHDAAARTLLEDAPELRRLLEQLGAGDSKVTVRDLGSSQQATNGQQGAAAQSGTSAWTGERQGSAYDAGPQQFAHDRARTPGHHATDGTTDAAPGLHRTQQDDHRSSGVDLTM